MAKGRLEQLPAMLLRRNWLILGILLLVSLPFADLRFSLGILAGGLVAIAGFSWQQLSVKRLISENDPAVGKRYQFGYVIRLFALGGVLAALVAIVKIDIVGLLLGLSVVVVNLLWLALQRALP